MGGLGGDEWSPTDDFLAHLAQWAAGERVARAAAERTRTRTLADQSTAMSTWTGLLVDLAEGRAEVTLSAGPGLARSGRLVGVAQDFVVLERPGRGPVLVRSAAVESVTPAESPRWSRRAGERTAASDLTLAAALEALAGERAPVTTQLAGQVVQGTITGCGEDVLTIQSDGAARRAVYVPLNAVLWIEIR